MIFEDRGIQRQAGERHAEQCGADEAQSGIRHHPEKRQQREAFEGPAERDPFTFELKREDKAEEEERRATLPGEARVA
jgi:hypothetical protein